MRPHRFFFEPFLRSDNLVRLNTSLPVQGLDGTLAPFRSAAASALVITRNKEFSGSRTVQLDDFDEMDPSPSMQGLAALLAVLQQVIAALQLLAQLGGS
jgi:hypothetical protein